MARVDAEKREHDAELALQEKELEVQYGHLAVSQAQGVNLKALQSASPSASTSKPKFQNSEKRS